MKVRAVDLSKTVMREALKVIDPKFRDAFRAYYNGQRVGKKFLNYMSTNRNAQLACAFMKEAEPEIKPEQPIPVFIPTNAMGQNRIQ